MKNLFRYLKHIALTTLVIAIGAVAFLLLSGNKLKYNPNYQLNELLDKEGPFIIYHGDSVSVNYIHGDYSRGFSVQRKLLTDSVVGLSVYYPLDNSSFPIVISPYEKITPPPATYETREQILVVSDIEGNYKAFRDFLIGNHVIDAKLNWIFGKGHLVLLGDFVDRGFFVTQVLYLIYRLEKDAAAIGGKVHFILGNHEIMNMQGDHSYSPDKYAVSSAIVGLKPGELFDPEISFLAQWLASKNTVERINETLFTHGGLHPEFARFHGSLDSLNANIRRYYNQPYFPKAGADNTMEELQRSTEKCPYWYRGYFNDDISVAAIDSTLHAFKARVIVVGHTVQAKVSSLHEGRVIGIDVEHPQERWGSSFPALQSEGLLIIKDKYFRVLDNGEQEALEH